MNETGDIVSNLPAIMLLSFWWAFLSTLDLIFGQGGLAGNGQATRDAAQDDAAAPADPRLKEVLALDPRFDASLFVADASTAYEQVVALYGQGELELLEPLLAGDVLAAFAAAGEERRKRGETLELTLVGIESAEIAHADVTGDATGGRVEIGVRFHAQIISVVRASSGAVVAGDPSAVVTTDEIWVFARSLAEDSPAQGYAWRLSATCPG